MMKLKGRVKTKKEEIAFVTLARSQAATFGEYCKRNEEFEVLRRNEMAPLGFPQTGVLMAPYGVLGGILEAPWLSDILGIIGRAPSILGPLNRFIRIDSWAP
jgi:hypothetical protein